MIDAQNFSRALKEARQKRHLTQAECSELLDLSLSFQKDLERCRCSPSIDTFFHICRTLNISADRCVFPEQPTSSTAYSDLLRMLALCSEEQLSVLAATASALLNMNHNSSTTDRAAM